MTRKIPPTHSMSPSPRLVADPHPLLLTQTTPRDPKNPISNDWLIHPPRSHTYHTPLCLTLMPHNPHPPQVYSQSLIIKSLFHIILQIHKILIKKLCNNYRCDFEIYRYCKYYVINILDIPFHNIIPNIMQSFQLMKNKQLYLKFKY